MKHVIFGFMLACLLVGCVTLKNPDLIDTKIIVSSMFKKYTILQRGKPVPVWGVAQPRKMIKVSFAGQEKSVIVDADGTWKITLDAMDASSTPREMSISYVPGEKDFFEEENHFRVALNEILVGEVWFCSGQSNMELGMAAIENHEEECADANYPDIRLYFIGKNVSPFPLGRISTAWVQSDPDIVATMGWKGFSAVAFMFARNLHKELKIPIGIILSAYGGSYIHPWIPADELGTTPELAAYYSEWEKANKTYAEKLRSDQAAVHPFEGMFDYNKLKPVTLYNAMVHPVTPFAIAGFIWYQGESNVGEGMSYTNKLKALIAGWRRVFAQGDLPFYYVQIAPYSYGGAESLPRFWAAQAACLSVPNTGMALTVDVGDVKDIHPVKKGEVSDRLARIALSKAYGRDGIVYQGPVFKELLIEKDRAIIVFDHTGSGLVSKDGKPLTWFTVAGDDLKFVPATARIVGNTVIVESASVREPAAVRYAWSGIAQPNLMNMEGLPAMPFRTDK